MSSKRVKVRPLRGGTSATTKNDLCNTMYEQGIKFSRIIPTGDTLVVVCLNEDEVDKLIATPTTTELRSKQFEVLIPPHLKAKKTVIIKRLDRDLTEQPVDVISRDIEERNLWAKVEETIKFPRMSSMLKVRFTDIKMARKATEQGLSIGKYHMSRDNVELEDFVQLTPCWSCYKYNHNMKDCPDKNIKRCSECAAVGHTFRDCNERTNFKCLNCDGPHRTLASICPIRKEKIKEIREQRKQNKKQFETDNRTYCAVTKLSKEIPKITVPEQPILNLNNDMSFKAMVILIHAHLSNIANPGCFGATVKELLRKNNLPLVELPDHAPSAEIFRVAANFPNENININMQTETDSDSEDEVEVEVMATEEGMATREGVDEPELEGAVGYTAHPESGSRHHHHQQHTLPSTHCAPPPPPPSPRRTSTTTTARRHTQGSNKLGLELYSSSADNIPNTLSPQDLTNAIKQGRVKYTYIDEIMPEAAVLRYFTEGKLTTERYPIQRVDRTTYKKIRNGLKRTPGDQERYKPRISKKQ